MFSAQAGSGLSLTKKPTIETLEQYWHKGYHFMSTIAIQLLTVLFCALPNLSIKFSHLKNCLN